MGDLVELQRVHVVGEAPGPRLLVTGGVHGDEFEPMAAIRRLMKAVRPAGLRGRLTLAPVVNEPAFVNGDRVGDDGLDLARVCPGRADGKPTERIAHALAELIHDADYYIDLHTGGTTLMVLPMAGYSLHPDRQVLETQRRMARAFNLPIIWGTTAALNGRSLSVARDAKVPAIYAEWGGGGRCEPEGIEAYVEGCLNVMGEIGMIERERAASKVRDVVEDDRPESGHMQLCNQSPMSGFFEPAVKLGERIEAGTRIGTVSDPLGKKLEQVTAGQKGTVLVLKTFARVKQGDALAVILETDRAGGGGR